MKVVRQFSKPENRLKLQVFRNEIKVQDSDLAEFNQTWKELGDLITYWLTTPQEEVKSNQEQKEKLSVEVDLLRKGADTAKDNFKKESEACKKRQEANQLKKKTLQDQVADEKSERQNKITEAKEKGQVQAMELKQAHED